MSDKDQLLKKDEKFDETSKKKVESSSKFIHIDYKKYVTENSNKNNKFDYTTSNVPYKRFK